MYINEGLRTEYETEEPVHKEILPVILETLPKEYELGTPVKLGGAGVICTVRDAQLSALQDRGSGEVLRALKWPRPLACLIHES